MRSVLILTAKDLRRRLAAPAGLLLNMAIPVVLGGLMALAFGGDDGGQRVPALRLLVLDRDASPLSSFVTGASQNPEAAKRLRIGLAADRQEAMRRLREEEYAALLVIPEGFGDVLLEGGRVDLELIKNPSQSIMPVVAQQGTEVLALYLSVAARLLGDETPRVKGLLQGEGWDDAAGLAAMFTTMYERMDAAGDLLFPPIIELETEQGDGTGGGFDLISWMYPGLMVMGLLFVGLTQMRDLLREREAGTLRRQLSAPLGPGGILLSKVLGVAAVVAMAQAALMALGSLSFGIDWGPPARAAAASALLVFAVTGFAALVFSVVRTERQGDAFGGMLVVLMSLAGGAFVPAQLLPEWLRGVAVFTVNHAGHEALRTLVSGGGWDRLAGHLAALAAMGLAFSAVGVALMKRRHLRGTL